MSAREFQRDRTTQPVTNNQRFAQPKLLALPGDIIGKAGDRVVLPWRVAVAVSAPMDRHNAPSISIAASYVRAFRCQTIAAGCASNT